MGCKGRWMEDSRVTHFDCLRSRGHGAHVWRRIHLNAAPNRLDPIILSWEFLRVGDDFELSAEPWDQYHSTPPICQSLAK